MMRWLGENWGWLLFGLVPLGYFAAQGVLEAIRRQPSDQGTDYWT